MNNQYKLSDSVLARLVQIVQEALYTGTDVVDLMRQITLQQCNDDPNTLVLTDSYLETVNRWHAEIQSRVEKMEAECSEEQDD